MDDWDNIDWDEKVKEIKDAQEAENQEKLKAEIDQARIAAATGVVKFAEDDGNYFEANTQKKLLKAQRDEAARLKGLQRAESTKQEIHIQPYSSKDLERIFNFTKSSYNFHNLIYETFGQLERFILTHEQTLTDDFIVSLLVIDVAILEVPLNYHNELLLEALSSPQLATFWSQLISFMEKFLSSKQTDVKFLLAVDMNKFFDNIEVLMYNLLVNNFFNVAMQKTFEDIIKLVEAFPDNKWCQAERLKEIQLEYLQNLNELKIYDVSLR